MAFRKPGGQEGGHRRRAALLAASARLYGALLVLYPETFRRRYASEMQRDFRDLSREGLEEGGGTELARVWVAAFLDLALSALKERSTMLARNTYLPVALWKRLGVVILITLMFVGVAVGFSLLQTPVYEASAKILVGMQRTGQQNSNGLSQDVERLQQITPRISGTIPTSPVAEEVIRQLGLPITPQELLGNLSVEQVEDAQFIQLSYRDTDPQRAQEIVNTISDVSSERISQISAGASDITLTVWEDAVVLDTPVSPNPIRNGLLMLVFGLMLSLIMVALAHPTWRSVASVVTEDARQRTRPVGRSASGAWGTPAISPDPEATKEKELLEALGRHGELTVARAALETSLSVEEAERMLSELAAKGHLEVRVRRGRLLYALWQPDATE